MKRSVSFLLLLSLILSGCGLGERIKEPVTFYYIRSTYQEDMVSVIQSEEREASGHRSDLSYLLKLYLMGPSEDELRSPLPRGAKISAIEDSGSEIHIQLTDLTKALSDAEYALACACLSLTCFDLTDAGKVTVTSGEWSITLGRDSLTLTDGSTAAPTEEVT